MTVELSGRAAVASPTGSRALLSRYREALLGSAAGLAALVGGATPSLAACNDPVNSGGVLLIQCSGTMTSTNVPGITYSSATDPFEILSTAAITTTGNGAYGIYGYGASVYALVNSSGSIKTTGQDAHGILLHGNNAIAIAMFNGSILTSGSYAYGIYVNAWSQTAGNAGILSLGSVTTSGMGAHGLYVVTDADGSGMTPPNGAIIRILAESAITTSGEGARGIVAENFRGGFAGTGDVTVTSKGSISTSGNNAEAILVTNHAAGTTSVANSGSIVTRGTFSHGISVSNGLTAGAVGDIEVSSTGSIRTFGVGAHGVRATASGASGNVTVGVGGSTVTTGAGASAIFAQSAAGNVNVAISSTGSVSSLERTIDVSGVSATVTNAGTIHGNVFVSAQNGLITNQTTGVINSGDQIAFSAFGGTLNSGVLSNAGTLAPGGAGALRTTTLTGDYVQTSTGRLAVDTSWTTGTSDQLVVTGTATLAGTVIVNPINLGSQAGMTRSFTILTAGGGIVDNGISVMNTAAATYTLAQPDANTLNVNATINFLSNAAAGLNTTQSAVATALNQIFGSGGALGFMPALLTVETAQYARALQQLTPIGDSATFSGAMQTGNTFANHLLSCRDAGRPGDGDRFVREGQCVWARVGARRLENDGSRDGVAFGETSSFLSAGAQLKAGGDWQIGAGMGFEQADLASKTNAAVQSERLHLGGVLKYTPGPWTIAGTINGGVGWHENARRISFAGFNATARSEAESSFVGGRLTTSYLMSRGMWYAKPQVEVGALQLTRDAYTETGGSGAALSVAKNSASVMSATPTLEVGAEHRYRGAVYRGFARGGATFRDTDVFVTTATFAEGGGATAPFSLASRIDRITADFGAGIDAFIPGRTSLRVQYDGQLGASTTNHSGAAKLSVKF